MKTLPDILTIEVPVAAIAASGLPRIDFADGYRMHATLTQITALQAARAALENPPRFVTTLMAVRNSIVARFGLKGPEHLRHSPEQRLVGAFPVISESTDEIVLGGDDKHLDFRIWIAVQPDQAGCTVTLSTLVQLNNRFGKFYLFVIMPFHRWLSRLMLRRGVVRLGASRNDAQVL